MASTESVSHDDLVVCACGNLEYQARDAIHAALFRGELEAVWKEFLQGVESAKLAEELDSELDEDAFDAAAEAFRYERDLITAEETEHWLVGRGLTLDDFADYFSRHCWATSLGEKVDVPETDYLSATREMRDLFAAHMILSGELEHMTTSLSWRLAALSAEKERDPDAMAAEKKLFLERHGMEEQQKPAWLERIARDHEWFDKQIAMEAAFQGRCSSLLGPQAHQKELATLRLPLTRFETEVIELESRDAAQEALFCVREDGMSMEEVAAEGRYPYHRVDFILEDIPEDQHQQFLSVIPGEILDPIARGDGFELCRVINKVEPQPDDPNVKQRVEQRLLDRHFDELTSKYIERRLGASTHTHAE